MIDLHTWPTPNGYKISIMLEETGLAYRAVPVDIGKDEQFAPDFLRLSPNGKIPAILDHDGPDGKPVSVFETGAILIYLAEKTGRFLPAAGPARYAVLQWLMFQMGGIGPMFGQANHFLMRAPEKLPYAIDRYVNESGRLWRVMDKRLAESDYIAGEYSIADMALFCWMRLHKGQGQSLSDYPHVKRWLDAIYARPAVARGLDLLRDRRTNYAAENDKRDELLAQLERGEAAG